MTEILAPMQGTVIGVAAVGDPVSPGKAVVVIESMKIECPVELHIYGTVRRPSIDRSVTRGS